MFQRFGEQSVIFIFGGFEAMLYFAVFRNSPLLFWDEVNRLVLYVGYIGSVNLHIVW